jgi:hypothetical protein
VRSEKEIREALYAIDGITDAEEFWASAPRWALDGQPSEEQVVTGCEDCPAQSARAFCRLAENRASSPEEMRAMWAKEPPPDWCPLRSGPMVLRLEEGV